jgi:hypothetical protein
LRKSNVGHGGLKKGDGRQVRTSLKNLSQRKSDYFGRSRK